MTTLTPSATRRKLLAKLHMLILQIGADKEALYSSYGVSSATELSIEQLIDYTSRLEGKAPQKASPTSWPSSDEVVIKRMRSEVLCLMTRSATARDARKRGLGIPNDWSVLNPWIKRRVGKLLPQMSIEELSAFRCQLLCMRTKGWFWDPNKDEMPEPVAQIKPERKRKVYEYPILINTDKRPS